MSVGRDSMYNLAGSLTPLVLALVTIPLYLSAIGTERYGALAIAWLILGYFGLFDLGLGRATAQRIATLHESSADHRARVFWTAAGVNIGLGIVGAALLYAGANYFFTYQFEAPPELISEALEAVPFLALAVPVATLTGVAMGALQGREHFLDVNASTVAGTSLFQLLPLAVAYLSGPELKWLVLAAVIARLLGLLIFYTRVQKRLLKKTRPEFDRSEWKALLKFGGWVSVTTLIGPLIIIADRFLIGAAIGATAVAVYSVAFDVARRLSIIPNALGQAIFPRIAKASDEKRRDLMLQSLGSLDIIMTVPVIGAIFLIGPFLELWVGQEVGAAATIICQILLVAYWANAFAIVPFVRLQAQGRPDIVTKVIVAQAPFHLAALYFALLHYGVVGAAIVVAARSIIEVFVLLYFANGGVLIPRSFVINAGWLVAALLLANHLPALTVSSGLAMILVLFASLATSWMLVTKESKEAIMSLVQRAATLVRDRK